ncbi:VWA domain-containing protein [bacterium]|nr:VWA domain-containing protein [bacterium]
MSEKKVGKRLLTWVLVLVMTLSLLPLNVLAANGPETDSSSGMDFDKRADSNGDGTYTITMTAQATGTTTTKAVPMDIVLVLDQSGSMKDNFGNGTRQSAMKEAVNSFIGEVAAKYSTEADHRMAIVTFGTNADPLVGWTAVDSDGATKLTGKISSLPEDPSGATNVGEGMELAKNLTGNDAYTGNNTDRQKTVIVFTDGVPTTKTRFNVDVANKALEIAQNMKNDGVSIYTIGVFSGADIKQLYGKGCNGNVGDKWGETSFLWFGDVADVDRPAGNRFLNYLSSNFKNADKIGLEDASWDIILVHYDGWEITQNFTRTSSDYYLTASDASELADIFEEISSTVPAPGNPALDENTVITDTLSDYFMFAGTADDVKVYAKKLDGSTRDIVLPEGPDGIDVNGKTVTVTGYDFSKHYQGIGDDAEETLVIEIKVKPDPTATWRASDDYETNEGNATVTLPNIEKPIAEAASPKVHVDTYKVTYQPGDDSGNEYTDQYYLNKATTKVLENRFIAPDGYEFDRWKDGDGKTYQVGADITFDKSDVTLTAQWKEIEAPTPALVTLTANSMTVTYNGQPHNGSPHSCEALGLLPGHMVKSVDYTCKPQTNVGEYDIELDNAKIVDAAGNDVTDLYQITYNYGKLIIEPCDVTVTIKGNTGTYEYDGTEKTVEGYTLDISNDLYKAADVKRVDSQAKIRATVPGTYQMGLKPENFENTNLNFNVTFVVKPDGKLTIENRPITITANDVTGKYDGQPHGENGYSITAGSLVDGHAATVTISGSKTDAGEYEELLVPSGTKIVDAKNKDVTGYYDISYEDGTLTINKRSVTLTSETASKVYDGTPLTKPEVTVTGDGFVEGEVTDIKATGTITDVGTVTNTIEYAATDKFKTDNYDITKNEGTLKVTPVTDKVTVTIKGNTKTVRYNGKEQSVTGFTYTAPEGVRVTLKDGFKDEAKGTDKGTYYMGLTKDAFIVSSNIYKEFKIVVNDGYLEITRSGGHHPRPKPTVEIEDDDALGLNTTDHFAYIVGYGNGEVRPQNNITRAEVATIFFRLLTDDVRDENLTKTNRYSDVAATSWYNTAVSTLSSMGIITGYPDGTFRPNAAITRAEFAAITARFDNDGDKTAAKFSDIATHWAKDEISIAYNNGWINGYPNGTFGPQRDITRAETMTLVNRVLNRQPETEDDLLPNMTVWTDNANPNAWYYLAVQEATNSHYYKFKTNSKYEKWTELRETRDWTLLEK